MTPRAQRFALVLLALTACLPICAAPARHAESAADTTDAQVDGISALIEGNLWQSADQYFDLGDYRRSIALSRIIVAYDPSFVECYSNAGWLTESLGDLDDAEAIYQEAVARNPASAHARFYLGNFYFNTLKDYPSAIAAFQAAVRRQDSDVNDWKMLAHAYEHNGSYDLALATWIEIDKRWPNAPAVRSNLDRVKALVGAQHAPRAR